MMEVILVLQILERRCLPKLALTFANLCGAFRWHWKEAEKASFSGYKQSHPNANI